MSYTIGIEGHKHFYRILQRQTRRTNDIVWRCYCGKKQRRSKRHMRFLLARP